MKIFVKKLFLKNWGLKLFSLLLALVLWLTLIPPEKITSEKTLTVPLELYNIPSEMELVEKPPATVDIKIRAPNRLLNQISSANVHAVLDLKKASIDQTEYPLNKNMISIPEGAEVKDINPSQVKLKLERTKELMLEVVPNIIGELGEGLKLEKVEVIPSKVPVKGPESKVKDTYKLSTSPIDISSLNQSADFEADVILPNPDLQLASSQTTVRVRIVISEEKTEEEPTKKAAKIKK